MADADRILLKLDDAREFARTFRFEITEDYRAMIAAVEAMPANQPGADKSGGWLGSRADRQAFFDGFSPARRT